MKVVEGEIKAFELSDFRVEDSKVLTPVARDFLSEKTERIVQLKKRGVIGGGPLIYEKKIILKVEYRKTSETTGDIILKYFGLVT